MRRARPARGRRGFPPARAPQGTSIASAMKGVVLAGGTGSRLDPLTRITNKHLLPVDDRPMVMYAIEALREAGVTELMVVTGGDHVGISTACSATGSSTASRSAPAASPRRSASPGTSVGGDRVVVMLADNIFGGSITQTIRNFGEQREGARVLLAHVRETEHLRHLGVPRIEDGRIAEIVEKPVGSSRALRRHRALLLRGGRVRRHRRARAVRARRAGDHRREQPLRPRGDARVRRLRGVLGRRRRVDRRVLRGDRARAEAAFHAPIACGRLHCAASRTSVAG